PKVRRRAPVEIALANRTVPSLHSRAAKRATSPSINLDKSITTLPRPSSPSTSRNRGAAEDTLSHRDNIERKVLDIAHRTTSTNGVTKSRKVQKRGTARTRQQKRRAEAGKEKAEAAAEIL